jgi:hypothetical protein
MSEKPSKVEIPSFETQRDWRALSVQILVISVVILAILGYVGYLVLSAPVQAEQRAVTFRIEGSVGSARITYTETDGHQTNASFVTIPWQPPAKMYRGGMQVFLTAGSPQSTGTITCVILLDSQEWKRESSSASEGKVACGGIVP